MRGLLFVSSAVGMGRYLLTPGPAWTTDHLVGHTSTVRPTSKRRPATPCGLSSWPNAPAARFVAGMIKFMIPGWTDIPSRFYAADKVVVPRRSYSPTRLWRTCWWLVVETVLESWSAASLHERRRAARRPPSTSGEHSAPPSPEF